MARLFDLTEPVHLPLGVFAFDGFPFVILSLSPGKADFQLGVPRVCHKNPECSNGQAAFLHLSLELPEFMAVQEQFTVSARLMRIVAGPGIVGYLHTLDVKLISMEYTVGFGQAYLAQANRFDLGAR